MSRSMLLALSLGTLSLAPLQPGNLPPQQLPVYGGSGGTAFTLSCGAGKVLTGLRFRAGVLVVDAVGLLCRSPDPKNRSRLGAEFTVGTMVGGSGGTSGSVSCPAGRVVTGATIYHGSSVNAIKIMCFSWDSIFKQPLTGEELGQRIGRPSETASLEECDANSRQPANGIHGRAGSVVDAIGFICDEL